MLLSIALPVPLYREFDYLPLVKPANAQETALPNIGTRVQVSFGRQTLIGMVVGYVAPENCQVPANKLKAIQQVIDKEPIFNEQMMSFAKWLASYYHYPLGETIMVMLPTFISRGMDLQVFANHWKVAKHADINALSKTAKKSREQFELIKLNGEKGTSEDVLFMEGVEKRFLTILAKKGLIEHYTEEKPSPKPVSLAKLPHKLNEEQQLAVQTIQQAIDSNKYQGFLLNGVTGSGKTEVYLHAMQSVLESGKQVLILVPEIGLTPQTKARFSQRFSANILLLHSALSDSARMQGWEDCQQGQAQIIIGTRSSLLYPFASLGLIIVDEAHDQSYKQQDSLRYQAADVSLYRGYQAKIPVILGTATPSLEQFKLVTDGKLTELLLTQRAGHAKPPTLQLIDARLKDSRLKDSVLKEFGLANNHTTAYIANTTAETHKSSHATRTVYSTQADGTQQNTGLTPEVITAISNTLAKGEQVLVFLNRRGYAPVLLCGACGWQADCPHCDSHLTLHRPTSSNSSNGQAGRREWQRATRSQYLKCHHCGYHSSVPTQCPDCHSQNLDPVGMGTTRLTDSLHAIFANPQTSKHPYPIIQIDRDTTRRKGSWQRIYNEINRGEPAILVGTQMIAKGHHFPKVTLVIMPNADRGFLSANFRSPEHTAQMIMQVAGRAGRATLENSTTGQVLIQTVQPDNPLLLSLVRDGYQSFAKQLLQERYMMGLPPYVHSCLIHCEGKSLERTHQVLQDAINMLPKPNSLAVSGVIDAPMVKKNGRYHSQIFLLANERHHLHQLLNYWWLQVLNLPTAKGVKLSLDVDPLDW